MQAENNATGFFEEALGKMTSWIVVSKIKQAVPKILKESL